MTYDGEFYTDTERTAFDMAEEENFRSAMTLHERLKDMWFKSRAYYDRPVVHAAGVDYNLNPSEEDLMLNQPGQIFIMPNPDTLRIRELALSLANQNLPSVDPHVIVLRAEAFESFLKGDTRELIEAEIRKWAEERGIPFDQPTFQEGEGVM